MEGRLFPFRMKTSNDVYNYSSSDDDSDSITCETQLTDAPLDAISNGILNRVQSDTSNNNSKYEYSSNSNSNSGN